MIHVDRSSLPPPEALERPFSAGPNKGKSEAEAVIEALEAHLAGGEPREKFKYPYKRYKEDEAKRTLDALFRGKCAYCETYYSASQPMDVEHWRPKGEVHLDDGTVLKPGYYWLAAHWDNLLPSCIDCNRAREQFDVVEGRAVRLGKANQFPLPPGRDHVLEHERSNALTEEEPLLVNPCEDDPEEFFAYTEEGVIRPAAGLTADERLRAEASIRVYALNRSGLVTERREVIRRIDHRLALLRQLAGLRTELAVDRPDLVTVVEELIALESDALLEATSRASPFAGLARYLLRAADVFD